MRTQGSPAVAMAAAASLVAGAAAAQVGPTGDPNGPGLPPWPRHDTAGRRVLHLDDTIRDAPDALLPRYEALDAYVLAQRRPKAP
jgi:carboxylesterase type B